MIANRLLHATDRCAEQRADKRKCGKLTFMQQPQCWNPLPLSMSKKKWLAVYRYQRDVVLTEMPHKEHPSHAAFVLVIL